MKRFGKVWDLALIGRFSIPPSAHWLKKFLKDLFWIFIKKKELGTHQ